MTNLQEMKKEQLMEIAKDMEITGRHKMNKQQLINEIQAKQTAEIQPEQSCEEVNNVEEAEEKPKKTRGEKRKIHLLNSEDEIVETFESRAEAIRYCVTSNCM